MLQFHTGSLDGATAILGLIPDEHFGVYIFGNLDHAEMRHALMYKAIDLWCANDNTKDWSADFYKLYKNNKLEAKKKKTEEEAKRVMNTHPSLSLTAYAGKSQNEIFGNAEIVLTGDSLLLKYPNNINLQLSHWNFDTFTGKYLYEWYNNSMVQFSLDESGKISQFEMDGMIYKKL
jgi:hypothetical protein